MERPSSEYMDRAIELAERAGGAPSPNPRVGAVVVADDAVVGEGYHEAAGEAHAEVNALADADSAAAGGTLFVTLEPCAHHGRTPPCTERIIDSGIEHVVVGLRDPNPESRRGIEALEAAGIETTCGVRHEQVQTLNERYLTTVREDRPFVVMKTAMTLDGKIASKTGDSRWISDDRSRRVTHELRDRYDAILVGAGTVRSDDPRLTARLEDRGARNPVRVVRSATLDVPTDATLFEQPGETIVATTAEAGDANPRTLDDLKGKERVEVLEVPDGSVEGLLSALEARSIASVLVEGGAATNWAFWDASVVDKVHVFVAPTVLGGADAVPAVGGEGAERIADAPTVRPASVEVLDDDLHLVCYPEESGAPTPAENCQVTVDAPGA